MSIKLAPEYIPALQGLEGFSHLAVLWWFSEFDSEEARSVLETSRPYKNAPEVLGIFATRSPVRPNPIALSVTRSSRALRTPSRSRRSGCSTTA